MKKNIQIVVLAIMMAFPMYAQINSEVLGKNLIYKLYNKRDIEKASFSYSVTRQNGGQYTLRIITDDGENVEAPMIVTNANITIKGTLNLSAFEKAGLDVSTAEGEVVYPLNVVAGQELPSSYFKSNIEDGEAISTTLESTSSRKVIEVTTMETPMGELEGYKIEVNTEMEMRLNGIDIPVPQLKSVEYFCPSIGLPVKTETYNRRGRITHKTIWKSIE